MDLNLDIASRECLPLAAARKTAAALGNDRPNATIRTLLSYAVDYFYLSCQLGIAGSLGSLRY
jgi:hypothetical protein